MTTESKSSSLRPVIGLDIGRSTVKAVTRSRIGNGSHKLVFPAIVANAFEISTEAEQKRTAIETVSINNKNYFFGDTAAIQTTSDIDSGLRDDWILTDEHKALFLGAIQRLKHEGLERSEEALVVVGLPGKLLLPGPCLPSLNASVGLPGKLLLPGSCLEYFVLERL